MGLKRFLPFILFLAMACSYCSLGGGEKETAVDKKGVRKFLPEKIYVFKESLPLDFNAFNANGLENRMVISDECTRLINQAILAYIENLGSVFPPAYQAYLGTLWIKESSHDLYIVVLKHPSGLLNTILIIRNSDSNLPVIIDYNIHAMYAFEGTALVGSNLLSLIPKDMPLLKITDGEKRGASILEMHRLYHNGTANLLEHSIFEIDRFNPLDTISYTRSPVPNN